MPDEQSNLYHAAEGSANRPQDWFNLAGVVSVFLEPVSSLWFWHGASQPDSGGINGKPIDLR
jgi:hypothetical protein